MKMSATLIRFICKMTIHLTTFSHSFRVFHFYMPVFSQTACLSFILSLYNKAIETKRTGNPDLGQKRSLADESLASIITSKMLNSTRHFTLRFLHEFLNPPYLIPLPIFIFQPGSIAFGCFVLMISRLLKHSSFVAKP